MKVSKDHSLAFSWAAIVGVAAFIITWVCAASVDTAWEFGVNTLSEFGVSDTDARFYFNYGCMITGVLIAVFGLGHAAYGKNAGHTVGGILLILGGALLALVGIFTMDSPEHESIAVMASLLVFAAIIAVSAGNWAADQKLFAGIGIVIVCFLTAMYFVYDIAELEAYGIILAMIWFLAESVRMIAAKKN